MCHFKTITAKQHNKKQREGGGVKKERKKSKSETRSEKKQTNKQTNKR